MNDSRTPQNNIGLSIPDDESAQVKIQSHEVEVAKIGFDEDGTPYRKLPDADDIDSQWVAMIRKDVDMAEEGIDAILQDAGYQVSTARFQNVPAPATDPDPAPIEPAQPKPINQRIADLEALTQKLYAELLVTHRYLTRKLTDQEDLAITLSEQSNYRLNALASRIADLENPPARPNFFNRIIKGLRSWFQS